MLKVGVGVGWESDKVPYYQGKMGGIHIYEGNRLGLPILPGDSLFFDTLPVSQITLKDAWTSSKVQTIADDV